MRRTTLLLLIAVLPIGSALAQEHSLIKRLGNLLDSMSVKGLDHHYIEAPKQPWQFIVKGNLNQSEVKLKSRIHASDMFSDVVGDLYWEPRIKTNPAVYSGFWAGYRGYGIGYSWNIIGDEGSILTFGATGGSYGINLRIHTFNNNEPEVYYAGQFLDNENPSAPPTYYTTTEKNQLSKPIKTRTMLLDAYYLFNGKRFSYAAAYDQSVVQKRSSGSLMVGGMFYYSHINFAEDENAEFIMLMDNIGRIKQWQFSTGAGYAYNLVPCKGLLVSAMVMPMLTLYNRHKTWRFDSNFREMALDTEDHSRDELPQSQWKLKDDPLSVTDRNSNIRLNIDAHLSIVYQWSIFFANINGQYSDFRYKDGGVKGRFNDWYINAALGVRF